MFARIYPASTGESHGHPGVFFIFQSSKSGQSRKAPSFAFAAEGDCWTLFRPRKCWGTLRNTQGLFVINKRWRLSLNPLLQVEVSQKEGKCPHHRNNILNRKKVESRVRLLNRLEPPSSTLPQPVMPLATARKRACTSRAPCTSQ